MHAGPFSIGLQSTLPWKHRLPADYDTMSFNFFSGRILTTFFAGLAATSINSPGRKGFGTFLRAGRAGLCWTTTLHRPCSVKVFGCHVR